MSAEEKARIRREVLARRDAEPDREAKSATIVQRILALPEYARTATVATYVGVKSEVATLPIITHALAARKRVVVPIVANDGLRLIRIDAVGELEPAKFGLLEPGPALQERADRRVQPTEVGLYLVPGVAFDHRGGRVGYGKGYYDRLLAKARPGTATVALAFECQVIPEVPMGPSDTHVRMLATELRLYAFDRVHHRGR